MKYGRWYPSLVVLGDGRIVVAGGVTKLIKSTSNPAVRSGDMSVITEYHNVQDVLADVRFVVPEPGPSGPVGSVSWLRASVCRFSNGESHDARLAGVLEQLGVLSATDLRNDVRERAVAVISAGSWQGLAYGDNDLLTRRVPMEALAAAPGCEDAIAAAGHVIALAGGYFPGSPVEAEPRADAALAALLAMIAGSQERAVATVTVMVQACDATGALISRSPRCLEEAGDRGLAWPDRRVCWRRSSAIGRRLRSAGGGLWRRWRSAALEGG